MNQSVYVNAPQWNVNAYTDSVCNGKIHSSKHKRRALDQQFGDRDLVCLHPQQHHTVAWCNDVITCSLGSQSPPPQQFQNKNIHCCQSETRQRKKSQLVVLWDTVDNGILHTLSPLWLHFNVKVPVCVCVKYLDDTWDMHVSSCGCQPGPKQLVFC